MSKELKKEYLEDLDHYDEGMGIHSTSYKKCKERLIRLAQIDSSKPSEALEIVDKMANYILLDEEYGFIDDEEKQAIIKDRDTIKQALMKAQEIDKENDELNEELGCPLEVVFKAVLRWIYYEDTTGDVIRNFVDLHTTLDGEYVLLCDNSEEVFFTKDYKKTWWLKKDKSE